MLAGNLSTTQIKAFQEAVILIPFGAFEQHGPHLPLLTDTIIAEEISRRVEKELPEKVMLYPAIWFGSSAEHRGFAGTLSLEPVHLMQMLQDLLSWLADSGFKRGILFNAHGGNVHPAATVCQEFSRNSSFKVQSLYAYTPSIIKLCKELFGVGQTHAGSTETSLLYALRPDLQITQEKSFPNPHPYPGGTRLDLYDTIQLSPSGILEAQAAITIDLDKGMIVANHMIKNLGQAVTEFIG